MIERWHVQTDTACLKNNHAQKWGANANLIVRINYSAMRYKKIQKM
jgi:hypothetical protein